MFYDDIMSYFGDDDHDDYSDGDDGYYGSGSEYGNDNSDGDNDDDVCGSNDHEGNVIFNDALNTFYILLYGVRHRVKDHSDNERGNPLPPHGLLFPISSKGSFICIIPQTG